MVRGSRYWRQEAGKLIAMLDVSGLPGEWMVRKPISVQIKNTEASRVLQEVLNVYRSKMFATRLPGGTYPQIVVNNTTNSLEIISPEPLATQLKEYAEEVDRKALEEPVRKMHVIPLKVKAAVLNQALQEVYLSRGQIQQQQPYGMIMPMQMQPYGMMMPMQQQPFGVMPGGVRRQF